MEIGEIQHVTKYNQEAEQRFIVSESSSPAFFMFYDRRGMLRKYGFIGKVGKHSVVWRKTKKEVEEEINNQMFRNLEN